MTLTLGLSFTAALCLLGLLLLFTTEVLIRPSTLPDGYVVHACYGSTASNKNKQVGVWWLSPYTKDAPRWAFMSPTTNSCRFIPWLPILPQHGSLMFPP
ncbi:MAG: hypothetical protein HYZ49_04850 [Chloroflexi bacterium]|nr:hypothetical protein [Chloroflexota bacterium]